MPLGLRKGQLAEGPHTWSNPALWRWATCSLVGLGLPGDMLRMQRTGCLHAGSLLGHQISTWDRMRETLWEAPTSLPPPGSLVRRFLRTPALGRVLLTEVVAHKLHGPHMCVRNKEIKMVKNAKIQNSEALAALSLEGWVVKSCVLHGTAGPKESGINSSY